MIRLADYGFLDLGDQRLEYRMIGPRPDAAPTMVLLHEGLGCVDIWGTFADQLAAATSAGVIAYSRAGYGRSSPALLPRPISFMNDEARVLGQALDATGFRRGLLVGHSDGASIALLRGAYASESYGPIMAGATLSALPLLLVFLVANRRIVEGVRVSGLKG